MTILALSFALALNAQEEDEWVKKMKEERGNDWGDYATFQQQAIEEYKNFRQKANAEYAKFLAEPWKPFDANPGEEIPWGTPKPTTPIIAEEYKEVDEPDAGVIQTPEISPEPETVESLILIPDRNESQKSIRLSFENVLETPDAVSSPQPIEPILPMPSSSQKAAQNLLLYGSVFPIHFEKERPLKLKSLSEKSIAKMWTQLADSNYDNIIVDCLKQREEHNLCDWAYIKLTGNVAENHCGIGTNEAVVMQLYLLTQSGFKMRIARAEKRLTLLFCSSEKIFRYKYFKIDGYRFYILDRSLEDMSMSICDHPFPGEKPFSMALTQPKLSLDRTEKRTIASKRYPDVRVTVETNKNLLDFYNDCPLSSQWNYYSKASLSNVLKESLYPVLSHAIEGKSELDAVNILLNFVQTGFEYATDGQQFGYERPLYPDETFYYPYCDCEDRSILFSCLVRELVGLDVVLLNYPGHLAAAVHFNEEVKGDYLVVDDKTYVIADPTFIGAPVGRCAKEFRSATPIIVKI